MMLAFFKFVYNMQLFYHEASYWNFDDNTYSKQPQNSLTYNTLLKGNQSICLNHMFARSWF